MPGIKDVVCKTIDVAAGDVPDSTISLEHLDSGITPSHIVVYAGEVTTAGGDAAESESVTGVLATDLVVGSIHTEGASPVTLDRIVCTAGAVESTWSADPSNDHVYTYIVYRAAS